MDGALIPFIDLGHRNIWDAQYFAICIISVSTTGVVGGSWGEGDLGHPTITAQAGSG